MLKLGIVLILKWIFCNLGYVLCRNFIVVLMVRLNWLMWLLSGVSGGCMILLWLSFLW